MNKVNGEKLRKSLEKQREELQGAVDALEGTSMPYLQTHREHLKGRIGQLDHLILDINFDRYAELDERAGIEPHKHLYLITAIGEQDEGCVYISDDILKAIEYIEKKMSAYRVKMQSQFTRQLWSTPHNRYKIEKWGLVTDRGWNHISDVIGLEVEGVHN